MKFCFFASFFYFCLISSSEIMSIWHNFARNEGTKDNRTFSENTLFWQKKISEKWDRGNSIHCRNHNKAPKMANRDRLSHFILFLEVITYKEVKHWFLRICTHGEGISVSNSCHMWTGIYSNLLEIFHELFSICPKNQM